MAITKIQSESMNLADTYAFTGTVTGAGEANTPAWFANKTDTTSVANTTNVKATFNVEIVDTDSAFASSTFTAPVTGDYLLHFQLKLNFIIRRYITNNE